MISNKEIAEYVLRQGVDLFIGGVGATSMAGAEQLCRLAKKNKCIVEAGIEAKYKKVWLEVEKRIHQGALGRIHHVQSCALFPADKASWYYNQQQSGGMLATHFSYAFLSVFNWLFGEVIDCNLLCANQHGRSVGDISEESAAISLKYANNVLCSALVSYVAPNIIEAERWYVTFFGQAGMIKVAPSDLGGGGFLCFTDQRDPEVIRFDENHAFDVQASAFIEAMETRSNQRLKNTPSIFSYDCKIIDDLMKKCS